MPGWTNAYKADILRQIYQRKALPAHYYIALVTDGVIPNDDTNKLSDLEEIAEGNGYTSGGILLTPGLTDFDFVLEDDDDDVGLIQLVNVVWEPTGGPIPSDGFASYAVMTDDNPVIADRMVLHSWGLGGEISAEDGKPLRLIDLGIRLF
jgi:hypothetical protein